MNRTCEVVEEEAELRAHSQADERFLSMID